MVIVIYTMSYLKRYFHICSYLILPHTLPSTVAGKETKAQRWAYPGEYARDRVTQLSVSGSSPTSYSHECIAIEIYLALL